MRITQIQLYLKIVVIKEYQLVVANRGEEFAEYGEQVAWLVEENKLEEQVISKPAIAKAVLERVASWL